MGLSLTAVFPDGCMGMPSCCASNSNFPGGGGTAVFTAGSTGCWGTWGAGGLVKVTYQ